MNNYARKFGGGAADTTVLPFTLLILAIAFVLILASAAQVRRDPVARRIHSDSGRAGDRPRPFSFHGVSNLDAVWMGSTLSEWRSSESSSLGIPIQFAR